MWPDNGQVVLVGRNMDWFEGPRRPPAVATGRLPLFCFFAGMVLGFLVIRVSVRLIRADVRWWPGNVTPRRPARPPHGLRDRVHVVGGIAGLAIPDDQVDWSATAAALLGVGTALVLDEFALILHLADVYWSEQGRRHEHRSGGPLPVTSGG